MKVIEQEIKYCVNCEKQTLHMRNGTKHNWVKTLVLTILTGGLYIFWLLFTAPIPGTGSKKSAWVCSTCSIEEGSRAVTNEERIAKTKEDSENEKIGYIVIFLIIVLGYWALS